MFKIIKPLFAICLICLLSVPAWAGKIKIGYVDLQRAVRETNEGKKILTDLKTEFQRKQGQLDIKRKELEKMKQELDKQSLMMTEANKKDKERELLKKLKEWQTLGMTLQKDLDRRQSMALQGILRKMQLLLHKIGQKGKYSLLLIKESVLYAPGHFDLTNQVIREYNEKYPPKTQKGKKRKVKGGKKR